MNITRENYEAFFLDYHEGNLTESQKEELVVFLVQNPDLKEEFQAFEMIELQEYDSVTMPGKETLKKGDETLSGGSRLEEQMISWHEGDLDDSQKRSLLKNLADDPKARRDFDLFGKVFLQQDETVVFADKASLKKKAGLTGFVILRQLAAAAAVIAFMVTLYFTLPYLSTEQQIAEAPAVREAPAEVTETPAEVEPETYDPEETPAEDSEKVTDPVQPPASREREVIPVRLSFDTTPLQLAQMAPRATGPLETKPVIETIDTRDEFYWFTFVGGEEIAMEDEEAYEETTSSPQYLSLTSLAFNRLERGTGVDIKEIESQVADRRFGLWDVAGYSLAGLSHLTGTSLAVEKERDENGRITTLAIGNRFKVTR